MKKKIILNNMENQETIDSKYIIIDKKGSGLTANVFLVKEGNSDKIYAAKVLKKTSNLFEKEIQILNELKIKGNNNPYIVNIVDSGEGLIIRNNRPKKSSQYLVLEYAPKGELFSYIYCTKCGLSELHSKVIFAKILKGIQACHNAGICHRDLKMQNILVDDEFNPKICDFGFATRNDHPLTEYLGTRSYAAPEILRGKPYDGYKADIFSLGVVLLTLTTCKIGFIEATRHDPYYKYIMAKYYETYWKAVSGEINNISQELKDLYIKMVSFRPTDRPSIDEILGSDWMKEVREMNQAQLDKLELEIRNELLSRESEVNKIIKQEMEIENQNSEMGISSRGLDDEEQIFDLSLRPKYAKTGLNMDNYIKLKGYMNSPSKFMNSLVNEINKEFKDKCLVEANKDKLKFKVLFEGQENEEEVDEEIEKELKRLGIEDDDEDVDNDIKGKDTVIQIKLYESLNGGYLLRYVRKDGNEKDFLDKMKMISSIIKRII